MTAFAIIILCIVFMLFAASARGNPGRGVADTALLVILLGIITIVDFVIGRFIDTGDAGKSVAIAFAAAFALDALYGLLAPDRQRARDKKLRRLMKRRA
jgi:hypothetical protein